MIYLLILIILIGSLLSVLALSTDCTWTYFENEVKVNCSGRNFTCIPQLNDSVTYLDLSHNKISSIEPLPINLKHFDISWNNIKQLKGRSFGFLPKLIFLDLSYCNLRDVDKGVFGELDNLQYLNISYNRELGFASLPNITFNLNKTKILSLNLNGINCATGVGTAISRNQLENIRTTNLTELFLASNRLELFEKGAIYYLPETISVFSLAANKLTVGEYLIEMHTMSNVRVMNMSYQLHPQAIYPYSVVDDCKEKVDKENENVYDNFSTKVFDKGRNWSRPLVPFPPKLETLYHQSSRLLIKNPSFSIFAPSLRHIYLQDNFIFSNSGQIRFINNTIITCDVSNNMFSHIPVNNGRHVKYLNISNNRFENNFVSDTLGKIFETFTSLELIDMSFNNIFSLPKLLFKNSRKLMYVNVSNNRLSDWLVDVSEMSDLRSIDLSENKFTTLSVSARNQFKKAFERSNLTINFFGNGLACNCDNQEFLLWLQEHKKHLISFEKFTCSTKDALFDFKNIRSSLAVLRKQCASYLGWYIACSVTLAMFSSFIIGVLLVKNKWKIRYLIYKSRQRFGFVFPFNKHLPTNMHYEYDAFLSYCGCELMFVLKEVIPRLEVSKNIRLLIRDRDYLPGIPKVDSTMHSLQESKRTICIVSKKYLASKWRDYELNMAKVEGIEDRGSLDYVILILLPEVYNGDLPSKIMDLIRKDRFIEYPMESCAYEDFWNRLIRMIE